MTAATLPELIVITDPSLAADTFIERMRPVLELGPSVGVQVRLPGADARAVYDYAKKVLTIAKENPVFVNRRGDVAIALGTHLHLPANAPRPREIRALFTGKWISASVHDENEARDVEGADLALVSPAFPPTSKPTDTRTPLGPEGISRVAANLSSPVFALGGVSAENVAQLRGRVQGVAVIGSVLHAPDPLGAATALLRAFRG